MAAAEAVAKPFPKKGKVKGKGRGYGAVQQAPQQRHMECLSGLQRIEVREKASMIEAVTALLGSEIEMANKYQIFNGEGAPIFYAAEQTDFCTRQAKSCCPDCAPWNVDILYVEGGAQMLAFKLERGCTWTCCCFNRPTVTVTDVMRGQTIGSIRDPFACCDLTFDLRDPQEQTVLKATGGCCQCGLCCPLPCGPCSTVSFELQDPSGARVGDMYKKVPSCCKFLFASDVDNYKVEFGGVENPDLKALLMALAIFVDFRYFSDNSNDEIPSPEMG